jgi:hypothetical protein
LWAVYDAVLDPKLIFFTDEAWCILTSGYINVRNNRYWSGNHLRETFELPLHDQNIFEWCAITATQTTGPILIQSGISVTLIVAVAFFTFFASKTIPTHQTNLSKASYLLRPVN